MTSKTVDLMQLSKALPKRQRGRACIVFTRDYLEQKTWAVKLAETANVTHLNLLDELAKEKQSIKMSTFSVDGLFKYLEKKTSSSLLIISGIEFIKATWAYSPQKAMERLAIKVETWDKKPALMFVMQYEPILAQIKFKRFPDLQFVIDQQNTITF